MFIAAPIGTIQRRACSVAMALLGLLWLGLPSDALAQAIQFSYSAQDEWADSQIMLFPGDRVLIDTRANWCNSGPPDAMFNQLGLNELRFEGTYLPDVPLGMALARIGDDIWPAIGRRIDVTKPGRLQFAMNDVPGNYSDNRGDATVTIRATLTRVVMPSFRGSTIAEAESFLAPLGLKADVQQGESDLGEGLIYDQRPRPGNDLHRVQPLVLYVLAGQTPVAVPDVVGQPVSDATRLLRGAELSPVTAGSEASAMPGWRVTRTEPIAQTPVARGTRVSLWLASGENIVPDVVDHPAGEGEQLVRAAGFADVRIDYAESSDRVGVVVEQSPMANSSAALTTAVELKVGQQPSAPPIEPPPEHVPVAIGRKTDRVWPPTGDAIWPYLVVGILGLGAVGGGAIQLTQRRKRIRTERHVHVRSSLDPESDSVFPDEVPASQVEIKVTLVAGATEFNEEPEILSSEVRND